MMCCDVLFEFFVVVSSGWRGYDDAFYATFESGSEGVYDCFVEVVACFLVASGACKWEGLLGFGDLTIDLPDGCVVLFGAYE